MKKTMLIFGMALLLLTAACGAGNAARDESPSAPSKQTAISQ